ncbi:hypothetical protein ABDK56_00190 [Sphingomonas sp. ASV193]|uniref:hypothetical protein n=1 Tax=Sphingomonas sp. ASV193 TaxID=3144405 RepID=UPI0032E8D2B1
MRVRAPRPLHGWRGFAGEVGIIVLGVMIALAANSIYDDWHWRQVLADERQALNDEVAANYGAEMVRVAQQGCIDRRLADLARVFERQRSGQALGIFAPIGRPTTFTGGEGALQMAMADESLTHMPLTEKQAYFEVSYNYQLFRTAATEERSAW